MCGLGLEGQIDGDRLKWFLVGFLLISVASAVNNLDNLQLLESAFKCASENNQFSFDLYDVLRQNNEGNSMLVSPLSLRTIMAMLQAGAEGSTSKEIRLAMKFPENNTELFHSYTAMRKFGDYIKSSDNQPSKTYPVTIEEANRIYIKTGFNIKSNFQTILKHQFQAPVPQIDFTNGKKAAEIINAWVSDQTHQRINKLIGSDALTNQTRMVLVNTLYFKGPWETRFHGRSTQKQDFHISPGKTVAVDMMNIEAHFQVVELEALNAKVIALPYEGKRFQMLIILPNNRFGLKNMENNLKNIQFSDIAAKLGKSKLKFVDLSLPKFSIESSFDLIETMKQMNMKELFVENEADFKGISEDEPLHVSKLVQKTFLTVEEQGSEAGAATFAAIFTPLSIGPTFEENIVVDHPFAGFIYDTQMNLILFAFRKTAF